MNKIINSFEKIKKNKKIVLAHGVFDVFHVGHKRHLEIAKSYGEILVVSLTSDKHVNKGPGRPFFNENLRAELISSLGFVDFVYINNNETPIKLIHDLKPNFYFKGSDYKDSKDDVTGNILKEKRAVEKNGGKIIYTEDIEFSSSNIINNIFSSNDINKKYKNKSSTKKKIFQEIKKLEKIKVSVIGEIIFDEYKFITELDKPGKENIQSVRYDYQESYVGGIFPIAKLASQFALDVEAICVGNFDKKQIGLLKKNKSSNLKCNIFINKFHTITKSRFVNKNNKKLFEEYILNGEESFNDIKIEKQIQKIITKSDLVIVGDFGHGLINKSLKKVLIKNSKFLAVNAQTNSGNRGFNLITKYKKADFVCLDKLEIKLALAERNKSISQLIDILFKKIKTNYILTSKGSEGLEIALKKRNKIKKFELPAFKLDVVDTLGAGDMVFALSSLLVKNKCDIELIALLGNLIGALQTTIVGHSSIISKKKFLKALTYTLK